MKLIDFKISVMETEAWDAEKLRSFINHYGLLYKDVAKAIGCGTTYIGQILDYDRPIEKFVPLLNAYKRAIRISKIAELQAYCEQMVNHYNNF